MNKIVKALKGLGYQVTISRLSQEEKAVWGSMVASATSEQLIANISDKEKLEWDVMVVEVQVNSAISIK